MPPASTIAIEGQKAPPTITIEEICSKYHFPRIDVLKLDCEGSEFSILENCDLSLLRMVVGEYHHEEQQDVRPQFLEVAAGALESILGNLQFIAAQFQDRFDLEHFS